MSEIYRRTAASNPTYVELEAQLSAALTERDEWQRRANLAGRDDDELWREYEKALAQLSALTARVEAAKRMDAAWMDRLVLERVPFPDAARDQRDGAILPWFGPWWQQIRDEILAALSEKTP